VCKPSPYAIAQRAVVAVFLLESSALCVIASWRYAIFRDDVDLGIFTQVIASAAHGFSSTAEGGANHLLAHWSPIIVVAWPFLRAFGPVGLQYVQAVCAAAVIFPIWGLARARFRPPYALAVTVVASMYPILWANGAADFHEMAFVPVLSATLVYALDRRAWTIVILSCVLLLCTKEDQFVILGTNGLIFAAISKNDSAAKRTGLAISLLAAGTAALYFCVVRTSLNAEIPYGSVKFYDWHAALAHRPSLSAMVVTRLRYVFVVLAPLALLPCISRYGLFLVIGCIEILASSEPVVISPGAHYGALLTGYALTAFVDGAANLARYRLAAVKWAVAIAVMVSVGVHAFGSPMEYWYYLYRLPNAQDALLQAVLSRLPSQADVGSEDEIFAHLGLDPNASLQFRGQKWFVYDSSQYSPYWKNVDQPAVDRALLHRRYVVASSNDGIVVLRKSAQPPANRIDSRH
jgi:uncharacterized membrane protein